MLIKAISNDNVRNIDASFLCSGHPDRLPMYLTCSICVTTDVYMCTYCMYLVLATICEVSQWAKRQQQAPHPIVTTVIYRVHNCCPLNTLTNNLCATSTTAFKQKYHNFKWPHPHPSLTPPPQPWPTKVLHPLLLNKVCITCSMIYKIYYLYDVPRFYTAPIGIRYNLCWYVYALVL